MEENQPSHDDRLSRIETAWTMVRRAHQGPGAEAQRARQQLIERYRSAVARYLRAAVGDDDAAEDLFQEFALRFVRGDFKRADPERGRFRKFLKTALINLVIDRQRRRQRDVLLRAEGEFDPAQPDAAAQEAEFTAVWRSQLLTRAGDALAEQDRESRNCLFTVLRFRAEHPEMRSAEMAAELSYSLGKPVDAGWVRKRLHYAREKFAELLLDEIVVSLEVASIDEIEQEALDLGLLEYCREALRRRREMIERSSHVANKL